MALALQFDMACTRNDLHPRIKFAFIGRENELQSARGDFNEIYICRDTQSIRQNRLTLMTLLQMATGAGCKTEAKCFESSEQNRAGAARRCVVSYGLIYSLVLMMLVVPSLR